MKIRIWLGVMKFIWFILAYWAVIVLASIVFGLPILLLEKNVIFFVWGFIWLGLIIMLYTYLERRVGYIIKAGHMAVIAEAITSGCIPKKSFRWAKEVVQSRFASNYLRAKNAYNTIERQMEDSLGRFYFEFASS